MNRLAIVAATLLLGSLIPGASPAIAAPARASLAIRLTLDAPADAAARTWTLDVLDGAGAYVRSTTLVASGESPVAVTTLALQPGTYTVQLAASHDVGPDCGAGALFRSDFAPASVSLEAGTAVVGVSVAPCDADAAPLPVFEPSSSEVIGSDSTAGINRFAAWGVALTLVAGFAIVRVRSVLT